MFLMQIVKFIGLSGIGWILDFCIFAILGTVSANLVWNNIISSIAGASFVFAFATRKIFHSSSKIPVRWKYVIYLAYQCILIFLVSKLLGILNGAIPIWIEVEIIQKLAPIISKIMITPVTMLMNFFIMKGIIEKL